MSAAPKLAGVIVMLLENMAILSPGGFTVDAVVFGFEDPNVPGNVQFVDIGTGIFDRTFTAQKINAEVIRLSREAAIANFVPALDQNARFALLNPLDERVSFDWLLDNSQGD